MAIAPRIAVNCHGNTQHMSDHLSTKPEYIYIIARVKVKYGWILHEWADVFTRAAKASENAAYEG